MSVLVRGNTVQFKKPLKEYLTHRTLLLIEQGSRGFVRDVLENDIHITIHDRDLTVSLTLKESDEYVYKVRV